MGYNADDPPYYVRPLLEEYSSLSVEGCGYKGSWVTFVESTSDHETTIKLKREVTNAITIHLDGVRKGDIQTGVTTKDVAKRDSRIGDVLEEKFTGHSSLTEAIKQLE